MNIRIEKGKARGKVAAPPSKSMAHRLLIAAAMANGVSTVRGISDCADVHATLDCLKALGVRYERCGNDIKLFGTDMREAQPQEPLYCRESGSTLRFMIPVAALSGAAVTLCGEESLMRRPLGVYEELFAERGLSFERADLSVTVCGRLPSGEYSVSGGISSQFITGLIFALPLSGGNSKIKISPPIESRSYIDLTLSAINAFGISAAWSDEFTIEITGGEYTPCDVSVEGDWSGAAFTDALSLVGGQVEVTGLNDKSLQGDRVYREHFSSLSEGFAEIDITDCPDLGPILFAMAAAKHGARIKGTRRLKIKESDRAAAMAAELSKFGAEVDVRENEVIIPPCTLHKPTTALCGHNDHRIVMSLAVLLTLFGGEIEGAEAISKSYPEFFDDLGALGIRTEKA